MQEWGILPQSSLFYLKTAELIFNNYYVIIMGPNKSIKPQPLSQCRLHCEKDPTQTEEEKRKM